MGHDEEVRAHAGEGERVEVGAGSFGWLDRSRTGGVSRGPGVGVYDED